MCTNSNCEFLWILNFSNAFCFLQVDTAWFLSDAFLIKIMNILDLQNEAINKLIEDLYHSEGSVFVTIHD